MGLRWQDIGDVEWWKTWCRHAGRRRLAFPPLLFFGIQLVTDILGNIVMAFQSMALLH